MILDTPALEFLLGWFLVGFVVRIGWEAADRLFDTIAGCAFNIYWWVRERIRS